MITILEPKSKYGPIDNGFILKWSSTIDGQSAYEVLYKLKESDTWSTSGKFNSNISQYDLMNIYYNLGVDFKEIQYKIKLWYNTTSGDGTLTGTEESDTYTLIFTQPISGYLNIYDGNNVQQYPLFTSINGNDSPKLNIRTDGGKLSTILVDDNDPLNSNLKLKIDNDVKSVANSTADLSNGYIARTTPSEFTQSANYTSYVSTNGTYEYYDIDSNVYYGKTTYLYYNRSSTSYYRYFWYSYYTYGSRGDSYSTGRYYWYYVYQYLDCIWTPIPGGGASAYYLKYGMFGGYSSTSPELGTYYYYYRYDTSGYYRYIANTTYYYYAMYNRYYYAPFYDNYYYYKAYNSYTYNKSYNVSYTYNYLIP